MSTKRKFMIVVLALVLGLVAFGCDNVSTTTNPTTTPTTTTTISTTFSTSTSFTTEVTTVTTTPTSVTTTVQSTDTTTTSKYLGLEVADITKTEYNLGTTFDFDSITVLLLRSNGTSIPLGSTVYTVSGFDSSTPGEKTITVSYDVYSTSFVITILPADTGLVITMEYYEAADGLIGQPLMLALRNIINTGFTARSYGDASYALDDSDEDPVNPNNVILVYTGISVSGAWDGGATWNKEHVWPQSLLGVSVDNSYVGVGSDLQNLKPAEPSINSSRGNKYYANETTLASFEPRDEVKGDIARILFYMTVMYSNLTLVDGTPYTYQMALLSVLLAWNDLDPVDDFERNRNEYIYTYQHNRNPFIDYPEFVDLIWDNL